MIILKTKYLLSGAKMAPRPKILGATFKFSEAHAPKMTKKSLFCSSYLHQRLNSRRNRTRRHLTDRTIQNGQNIVLNDAVRRT
uniref:Uncharacterized protein n=1 Tax=Romanomermis culicivorax TaxID=13658 RepID=A0A915HI53_ROMCU